MSNYYHIRRLKQEASERFSRLMRLLTPDTDIHAGKELVQVNGVEVRIAVDDFKTVLTEIRRLK